MGIVYWTPFCTTMGVINLLVFALQYSNLWPWRDWAFPSENANITQYFSSLVLHGSWQHLTNNAFCLFAFGCVLEKKVGLLKTALIYFASGVGGNFLFALLQSGESAIGASGCIFGLICSLVFTDPKALVLSPSSPLPIPIFLFAPLYVANEIFQLADSSTAIAHAAHIGGGIAGAFAGKLIGLGGKTSHTPAKH